MRRTDGLGLGFTDRLGSVDVVIGKVGYGAMTACAAAAVPMLCLQRPDWPEDPYFCAWMGAVARFAGISADDLAGGRVADALHGLLAAPRPAAVPARGADQVARLALARLGRVAAAQPEAM